MITKDAIDNFMETNATLLDRIAAIEAKEDKLKGGRRRITIHNAELRGYTTSDIHAYFNAICPTYIHSEYLGFGRYEVDFYDKELNHG